MLVVTDKSHAEIRISDEDIAKIATIVRDARNQWIKKERKTE
jgi:hypothetical protein